MPGSTGKVGSVHGHDPMLVDCRAFEPGRSGHRVRHGFARRGSHSLMRIASHTVCCKGPMRPKPSLHPCAPIMSSTQHHPRRLTEADQHVGRQIRILRQTSGLTLAEAASELGISCQMLHKYERGESRVGASRLQAMARLFGVPISAFLDDEGERVTGRSQLDLLKTPGAVELLRLYAEASGEAERRRMLAFVVAAAHLQA